MKNYLVAHYGAHLVEFLVTVPGWFNRLAVLAKLFAQLLAKPLQSDRSLEKISYF